ncbi:MAG: phosphatase PAP2 family protein [Bacillota bacterium]
MRFPPVTRPVFSDHPKYESFWLLFLLALTVISALLLIFAWPFTRSLELIEALQAWRAVPGVEFIFRTFTFIGDDEFFMILFSFLIWCVSKSLGFWSAFVLLSSATCSNLIKDITLLERPPVKGVEHPPGSYAFPSGHTLTAVTVWFYLAVRIKSTGFWVWTILVITIIALSRMVLGYHYLADILGGVAFGISFILGFLWLSILFYEKGWIERFSTSLLAVLAIVVPVILAAVLPGVDPPKILGYLAGASFGYVIEQDKIRATVSAPLGKQILKVLLGVTVLFGIIAGLGGILPSAVAPLGFIRYALGGVWVTLAAPALFIKLKLSKKE